MEALIGLLVATLLGLLYYKNKSDSARVDSELAEARGRDKELEEQEREVEKSLKEIDERLKRIKDERKRQAESRKNKTMEERASDWDG